MMNVKALQGAAAAVVFAQHHGDRKRPQGQIILIGTKPEIIDADTFVKAQGKNN